MIKTSNRKYDKLSVGTTVRLSIPDVDHARGSPRNVLAFITEVKEDLYKLCKNNLCFTFITNYKYIFFKL